MLTRRALFARFAAALALDPEKLLWGPRRKLISIAAPPAFHPAAFALVWPRIEIDSVKLVTTGLSTSPPIELTDRVTYEVKGRILTVRPPGTHPPRS